MIYGVTLARTSEGLGCGEENLALYRHARNCRMQITKVNDVFELLNLSYPHEIAQTQKCFTGM